MKKADFEEYVSARSFGDIPEGWTLRWDRFTNTFSVKFDKGFFASSGQEVIGPESVVMTEKEHNILYLQTKLADIARTGDISE